jgi:chromosome segregation ATPase|tara:strand:- start:303 stop:554 length:252 start_codon:yes stop_codon:yes gene_type:complete
MKEQNESILERQSRVEEKLEEIEQQFESCTEALEHILLSLNHLNSEIDELKLRANSSVSQSPYGWEPLVPKRSHLAETESSEE